MGNQNPAVTAVGMPADQVYLIAGQVEGAIEAAVVAADHTLVSALPVTQTFRQAGPYGGGFSAGYVTPSAGGRLAVLSTDASVSLVNPVTGALTATSAQASKAHPGGFVNTDYHRQDVCLGAGGTTVAVSYALYNLVRVWTVNSNGAGLTWEQDFTVTNPSGCAVDADGRPLVIAGVTATYDSNGEVTATSGGNVLKLNLNGSTAEKVSAAAIAAGGTGRSTPPMSFLHRSSVGVGEAGG